MTKQEYLAMDALALENLVKQKHVVLAEISAEIERLYQFEKSERERIQKEYGGPMATFETKISTLKKEVDSLEAQVASRTEELKELGKKHAGLHEEHGTRIAERKKEYRELCEKIAVVRDELHTLGLDKEVKTIEMQNLNKQLTTLKDKAGEMVKEISKLETEQATIIEAVRKGKKEHKEVEGHIEHIRNRREVLAEHVLTDHNKRLLKTNEKLEAMAQDKRRKK